MKKFIAVVFLIAYSFTSLGASVAAHPCNNKLGQFASSATQVCDHTTATASGCYCTYEAGCSITQDDVSVENTSAKGFNALNPSFDSFVNETHLVYNTPVSSSRYTHAPLEIYKLRLHLYHRVLLI